MQNSAYKNKGFTLLEVLIALSIFTVIGLASYRVLDITILSQTQIERHDTRLRALERAMHVIDLDIEQLIDRPIRDNYADELASPIAPSSQYALEFTRQGWRNPLQLPRSQLQRVAYELGSTSDGDEATGPHLLRHYWTVLDRAQDSEPRTQVLLKDIDDLQIRFLNDNGEWKSEWPARTASGSLTKGMPRALMLELNSPGIGHIQRLYQLSEVSDWQSIALNRQASGAGKDNDQQETPTAQDNPDEEYSGRDEHDFDPSEFHDLEGP